LRLIDSCITQLKAQGPSRTCNESKEEEEEEEEVTGFEVQVAGLKADLTQAQVAGLKAWVSGLTVCGLDPVDPRRRMTYECRMIRGEY